MTRDELVALLSSFSGATFASLDAVTKPKPLITKTTLGCSVILFTNKNSSGYENKVRRALEKAGRNPDFFRLGDLPFGERIPDTPLITHGGNLYLQTILLREGKSTYHFGKTDITNSPMLRDFGINPRKNSQDLPEGQGVLVSTYLLNNITRIKVLGDEYVAEDHTE